MEGKQPDEAYREWVFEIEDTTTGLYDVLVRLKELKDDAPSAANSNVVQLSTK